MLRNGGAVVLAGGRSTRFGKDKAFERLEGKELIQHGLDVLKALFGQVIVIANTPARFHRFDLAVASDVIEGAGSLGGILTGLVHVRAERCFVAACDMPFLNPRLIAALYECSAQYDIVVPIVRGEPEPLHAVYSKRCTARIVQMIARKQYRIVDLYSYVSTLRVEEAEWRRLDPEGLSFFNINTPADFDMAVQRLHQQRLALQRLPEHAGES